MMHRGVRKEYDRCAVRIPRGGYEAKAASCPIRYVVKEFVLWV